MYLYSAPSKALLGKIAGMLRYNELDYYIKKIKYSKVNYCTIYKLFTYIKYSSDMYETEQLVECSSRLKTSHYEISVMGRCATYFFKDLAHAHTFKLLYAN